MNEKFPQPKNHKPVVYEDSPDVDDFMPVAEDPLSGQHLEEPLQEEVVTPSVDSIISDRNEPEQSEPWQPKGTNKDGLLLKERDQLTEDETYNPWKDRSRRSSDRGSLNAQSNPPKK